jgi:integrase
MTVAAFAEQWLDALRAAYRPTTVANYQLWLARYVLPDLGGARLDRVQPLHLTTLLGRLAERGLKGSTLACVRKALSRLFGDATRWGLILANPCAAVPTPRPTRPERVVWSLEQMHTFVAYCQARGDNYAALWALCLLGGLRPGEAFGATWDDLDAAAGVLQVRRAVVWAHHRPYVSEPKTAAGRRTVLLPRAALAVLAAWRRTQAAWRLQCPTPWPTPTPIVTTRYGTTPRREDALAGLRRACTALGLPRLSLHGLRHQHASALVALSADPKSLQVRMGHTSASLTLNVYAHVLPDADRRLAEALDRALEG